MLNKMLVIGYVGSDLKMRHLSGSNAVTSFSLATNRTYNSGQADRKQETEWFKIVTWNRLAEICNQYITKGKKIYVEGRLRSNEWVGQDGQNHLTNEIVASQVIFLDRGRSNKISRDAQQNETSQSSCYRNDFPHCVRDGKVSSFTGAEYYWDDFERDGSEDKEYFLSYEEIREIESVDYGYLEDEQLDSKFIDYYDRWPL